ncbi:RagB/SusD family nutrient uptake outer membrane protein [Pedobacter mucosus]|uniref:RagB/SusD family nutrient uptake outer membrane protein n=1 Tax=Pedobacter mucosus TaxID=2895286 RepID=UPI001EE4EB35|nr:RagB/SusD family nutrient uptake outer membrane protein [Pedobacter mucosus]UKT64933.1 RagB/SusD family nutrient uptake outer membrane protein [Pedobacter mucosus]
MKTRIILYIAVIVFSGCKKLDLYPVNNQTSGTFYKNAEDAKAAIGAAYAQITSIYAANDGFMFIDLATTDDASPFLSGVGDRVPLWQYKISSSNTYINQYTISYAAIQKCNIVIERIPLIEMDASLKNQYVGEAKFIRALNYFNLVRTYGGVPLVTRETKSLADLDVGRATVDDVYALIEQDLKEAESLSISYPTEKGRATRGAAKGLLAKVYLTRAGATPGSAYWAQAASKAKEVMDLGVYDLWANYADAFSLANKGGKEFVFEIQYKTDVLGTTLGRLYGVRSAAIYQGGTGAGTARVSASLYNAYIAADKRKDVNFLSSYTIGATVFPLSVTNTDPTKAVAFTKMWDQTSTTGAGGKSFPYMRYAEILLIYAEALNEVSNGPNAAAYDAYKKVHERAGLTTPLLATFNYLAFKDAVLLERRLEFPFEIQRRFDLVRTRKLIAAVQSETAFGRLPEIKEFHYLLPIPQTVLNSSPSVTQNNGY